MKIFHQMQDVLLSFVQTRFGLDWRYVTVPKQRSIPFWRMMKSPLSGEGSGSFRARTNDATEHNKLLHVKQNDFYLHHAVTLMKSCCAYVKYILQHFTKNPTCIETKQAAEEPLASSVASVGFHSSLAFTQLPLSAPSPSFSLSLFEISLKHVDTIKQFCSTLLTRWIPSSWAWWSFQELYNIIALRSAEKPVIHYSRK